MTPTQKLEWPTPEPIPTKTVIQVDYDVLIQRLLRGPMWVTPQDRMMARGLAFQILRDHPAHQLAVKTHTHPFREGEQIVKMFLKPAKVSKPKSPAPVATA